MPVDTTLMVKSGDEIKVGDILAKMPQEATKVKDITGGDSLASNIRLVFNNAALAAKTAAAYCKL